MSKDDTAKRKPNLSDQLRQGIDAIHDASRLPKGDIEGDLAAILGVSIDTIRGWRHRGNIPSNDPQKVRLVRAMVTLSRRTLDEDWARDTLLSADYDPVLTEQMIQSMFPKAGTYIPAARCRNFFGRDAFVTSMLDSLEESRDYSVTIIAGGPGFGKTEVGREIALGALNRLTFDEVVWITARKTDFLFGQQVSEQDADRLALDDVINEISLQLRCGIDDVRDALFSNRTLVVLDNAETAQLGSILPELAKMMHHSHVLLTSRQAIDAPYIKLVPISGLDTEFSKQLLVDEITESPLELAALRHGLSDRLKEIHALTKGAPLALHFVASRVRFDGELEPVLSDLRSADQNVESFYRFCYETAWRRISDESKTLLRNLGYLHDAAVSRDELAVICELSPSAVGASLTELELWYLVERFTTVNGPKVDLHPWIRSVVRSGMVDSWQPSAFDIGRLVQLRRERIARWKRSNK